MHWLNEILVAGKPKSLRLVGTDFMYQGIIFDFNGVLFWDSPLHERAWREFSVSSRGFSLTDEEFIHQVHGRNNRYIIEYLLGNRFQIDKWQHLSHQKEKIYQQYVLAEKENYLLSPGAVELLDFLVAHNIPRTIATASEKENVDFYIDHLELARWFNLEQIVYNDGKIPGKPAPDMYLQAASNIHLQPDRCIVVEDSISGLEAARAAGIGYRIALGPADRHPQLKVLEGVSQVIENLGQISKELFTQP